ncbi:MAG TPA: metallophosphoesterase, partial [Myxococcales bacterium]
LCGSVRCDCQDPATATQLGTIAPDVVFTLGDNQYENGALADYNANFDVHWGQRSPIRPAVGNHEYNGNASVTACGGSGNFCSASAYMRANYYAYFSGVKTQFDPNGNGWYSYDVQTSDPARPWHVVVLNAAICDSASLTWATSANCSSTSPQVQWLNADLAANAGKCILAYWHEPRFSAAEHGNNNAYSPFWAALHAAHADVILQGHDHVYERYPALAANGVLDSSGPISFVVGTGGRDNGGCHAATPSPAVCVGDTFGVLKLTLRPTSWEYDFTSVAHTAVADRSPAPIACHN